MSLLAKKTVFELPAFTFQNGRILPVRLGYETFGTLTPEKDNVILVVLPLSRAVPSASGPGPSLRSPIPTSGTL